MESFKIYFGANSDNIRRVSLPKDDFTEVIRQLHGLYSDENLYHGELRIQYIDTEGDKITISSQGEWEEMTEAAGSARPIKLWIVEGMNPSGYFKDGPAPEPVALVIDGQTKVPITGQVADSVSIVVEALESLFPGGKILPYNLPTWLRESGAVTLKPVLNAQQPTEDFMVDLKKLSVAMNKEAVNRIRPESNRQQLTEAKLFLESVLAIDSDSADSSCSYYNLACANALLGNSEVAMVFLEKAHEKGYNNVEHMEKDSDLNSLRERPEYKELIKKMSHKEDERVIGEFEKLPVVVEEQKDEQQEELKEQPKEQPAVVAEEKKEEFKQGSQPAVQENQSSEEKSFLSEMVPFLVVLGVPENEALELLVKHQGDVEMAADEYYTRG